MVTLDFLLGVAAGLGLSGVTFLAIRWYQRRERRRLQAARPFIPVEAPPPNPDNAPDAPSGPPTVLAAPVSGDASPSSNERGSLAAGTHPVLGERQLVAGGGTVQLSHRVLLHLYRQGVFHRDEVPPRSLTQSGMIDVLQVRQGALAGVLLRLEAAGVVSAETTHVRGGRRRVKVYRLTDRGTQLAKGLRSESARPSANAPPR